MTEQELDELQKRQRESGRKAGVARGAGEEWCQKELKAARRFALKHEIDRCRKDKRHT